MFKKSDIIISVYDYFCTLKNSGISIFNIQDDSNKNIYIVEFIINMLLI